MGQYAQGRAELRRARSYYERALAIDEKVYGPDHPEVATGANNIGGILFAQGDLPGALQCGQRAQRIHEKFFGPDHPDTKRSANNVRIVREAMKQGGGYLRVSARSRAHSCLGRIPMAQAMGY
jgi:hypothetical protein